MQFNKTLIHNHPNHYFERRNTMFPFNTNAQNIKINEFGYTVIIGTVFESFDVYRKHCNKKMYGNTSFISIY